MKKTIKKTSVPGDILKLRAAFLLIGFLTICGISSVAAQEKVTLKINPAPDCGLNDICFESIAGDPTGETEFSRYFYVVVLKTTERCGVTEPERQKAKKLFPKNKAFSVKPECEEELSNNAGYEGIGEPGFGYVAVYAGQTKAEGQKFLQTVKAAKKYPGANLRKTRLIVSGN